MTGGNYQMIILISFHPSTFADVFNKLKIKSYIEKQYGEAFEMTIEDVFRAEKSYETRSKNTDLVIGTNGYGQFPYDLTVTSNSVFSPKSDQVILL